MRSIYHIREYNVRRLSLLSSPDIFLSHDWPSGIEQHGDLNDLLRRKPFFRGDIKSNQLGSPPLMSLLRNLQPAWWFAAHLHTRFEARVLHGPPEPLSSERPPRASNPDEITISDEEGKFDAPGGGASVSSASVTQQNPDEITLDEEIENVERPPQPPRETRFLALDKCLPRRQFLEVVDIPAPAWGGKGKEKAEPSGDDGGSPPAVVLSYDPEWLAITRAFQPYLSRDRKQAVYPDPDAAQAAVAREWDWVQTHVRPKLGDEWRVDACQRFGQGADAAHEQTEAFVALLEMENVVR